VSPYCIGRNLANITEASIGATQQELLDVLGGRVALDDANSALGRLLYADKSVILQIHLMQTCFLPENAFFNTICFLIS
jgi:hypothetical protein